MSDPPTSLETAMEVALLVIGDEILAGEVADANGVWLAEQLAAEGFRVQEIRILPDDLDRLVPAFREALSRHRLVLASGGLGPTSDDVTTEAVCLALGVEARRDEAAWRQIQALFGERGLRVPEGNEKQADLPADAEVLPNPRGTAPGYLVLSTPEALPGGPGGTVASSSLGARSSEPCVLGVLPGPPRENRAMFREALIPRLRRLFPALDRWQTRVYRVFGLPESEVGARLGDLEGRHPGVRLGYQARFPEILVKLRWADGPRGHAALEAAGAEVTARLAPHVYGEGEALLPEVLGRALTGAGLRVVTAESCTAGLCAKLLTDAPGSSAWMERGFVTYSNRAKIDLLGLDPALLDAQGAVSEPVAEAMLRGALARADAQVGVAVTGIAGPDGGTPDKPVGTVCIAWGSGESLRVRTHRFPFDRDRNRILSSWAALAHLLRALPHLVG